MAVYRLLGILECWNDGPGEMQKKISRGKNNGLRKMRSLFDTLGKSENKIKIISDFYTQNSNNPAFHHSTASVYSISRRFYAERIQSIGFTMSEHSSAA
jgi:hypothetical protein